MLCCQHPAKLETNLDPLHEIDSGQINVPDTAVFKFFPSKITERSYIKIMATVE